MREILIIPKFQHGHGYNFKSVQETKKMIYLQ